MNSEPQHQDCEYTVVKHGRDLTMGSIPRHLVVFALPMLAGSGLQVLYSFVNTMWVGRGLGNTAMAATTVTFPVIFMLIPVGIGLTMAANILVAQAYGAKDWGQLRRVLHNSIILTAVVSLACAIVGECVSESLLRVLHTDPNVLPMALSYLRIMLCSLPAIFGVFLIASLMRGVGDSMTPLYFQAASVILNAVLDPILMFGWLGLPKLGLNGTGVASFIASALVVVALMIYLQVKRHVVTPNWRHLRADLATTWLTLRIGVPSMVQQAAVAIGAVVIVGLVNQFGKDSAAAYGAVMSIDGLAFLPAMTFGMAVSTLSGQNIGANRHHRVHEVFRWGVLMSCGITVIASLLVVTIPGTLLFAFTKDPVVIGIGIPYLRIVGASYVLLAIMFASNGVINGAGHTFVTTIISLIALWAVRVPLATYLSNSTHQLEGIWYAMAISFMVGACISVGYYFSGRWKRPVVKHIPAACIAPSESAVDTSDDAQLDRAAD